MALVNELGVGDRLEGWGAALNEDDGAQTGPLPRAIVGLFAVACGLSVANVYYAQPLLDAMALEYRISDGAAGVVVSATQVGCAVALLLVVPLGDLLDRRRLILGQLFLLGGALSLVALAPTWPVLLAGMAAVGLLGTAMAQGLVAFAATLAAPSERGRVVGSAQGGVVIGLLLARTLAGFLADLAGWRSVYLVSAVLALLLLAVLARWLPMPRLPVSRLSYPQLLWSMFRLLRDERVLQVRGVIALLMFAAFSVFWTTLVFPLGTPPHSLSHTAIGAFGLVGAVGALGASRAGRLADQGRAQWTSGAALLLMLVSWWPIYFGTRALGALIVGIIALDLAGQALHVTNQSLILRVRPEAQSRLVGVYMLFYSLGSGLGSIASTSVYAAAGWAGVCALGAAINSLALIFWFATRRAGSTLVPLISSPPPVG